MSSADENPESADENEFHDDHVHQESDRDLSDDNDNEIVTQASSAPPPRKISLNEVLRTANYNSFDINTRSLIAFREIGSGLYDMRKFCGIMNIPPPIKEVNYYKQLDNVSIAYEHAANVSIEKAGKEHISKEVDVSLDGTFQRRGFKSMNGVVTAISQETKKVLDYSIATKTCKSCQKWTMQRQRNDPIAYRRFKDVHLCKINHQGSAGAMEGRCAVKIFKRSIRKHGIKYKRYLGDGDSKSFKSVSDSKPYGENYTITKLECIGHVQKRVGTRLRNLKTKKRGIGGKGKLTDKAINILQGAYGMAIRQNLDSVEKMRRSIAGIVWHYSQSETPEIQHQYCPQLPDPTWCKYQSNPNHTPKLQLPKDIKDLIKPIFTSLSNEELLSACTHGKTQNVNESINSMIWKRVPKETFVERKVLSTGVASAVICFNDGYAGLSNVFNNLGMMPGNYFAEYTSNIDSKSDDRRRRRSALDWKQRRVILRHKAKGINKENKEKDGDSYIPGGH